MRILLAGFVLPALLTGCGLPPAVSVASTVADGISYIVSGKSVSDNALSMVASRDCAMLRVLDGREICTDVATDEATVLLAAAPAPEPQGPWTPVEPTNASLSASAAPGTSTLPAAALPRRASARFDAAAPIAKPAIAYPEILATAGTVTVLGSYRDRVNAERTLDRLAILKPRLVAVATRRGSLYRVVSDVTIARARAAGIVDAWPVASELRVAANL